MPEIALSTTAQQWVNVLLIWIGFGTLAGLLATVLFPVRRAITPMLAVETGIVGSTIGLFGLSWFYPAESLNPISPIGFLAAAVGAFLVLAIHGLWTKFVASHGHFGKEHQQP
jgi:uncharacterized membrane protein YeaQ/YmgE (transglycosylase-associated protein family)